MNIILVSNRLSKAMSFGPQHLWVAVVLLAMTLLGAVTAASWATWSLSRQFGWNLPTMPSLQGAPAAEQRQLDALAVKLGQMQAQLLRLDGLTKQVADKTGIDPKRYQSRETPPQGGADSTRFPLRAMSFQQLTSAIAETDTQITAAIDQFGLMEAILTQQKLRQWQAPANLPTATGEHSSVFGWRIDPFSGKHSFHEGVDFLGEIGTPILAAAPGVVVTAEYHSQYGNMVEVDHGNSITSRYAHASRLLVKTGDVVKTGDTLSLLGSTGRSTGPHLHFEIRYKGVPQNPLYFLSLADAANPTPSQALATLK
jgi:murein DD-endopeptidase MepM/ murein hydrolase activator NlpD